MTAAYVEFEFDLPDALLKRLITVFDDIQPAQLVDSNVSQIPDVQGVYQLFLKHDHGNQLVYIGKTDAESGLRHRLGRHATKMRNRLNLDPSAVLFKAVRVFVFTAIDLEAQLIEHYGRNARVSWNGSGFGSNDPGKERDGTTYKADHFDAQFPIDLERPLALALPATASAADILKALKDELPYVIRFQSRAPQSRRAHADLEETIITLDQTQSLTPESIIAQTVRQLPQGWHATMLPSHVIIYKNDNRVFPSGRLIARS